MRCRKQHKGKEKVVRARGKRPHRAHTTWCTARASFSRYGLRCSDIAAKKVLVHRLDCDDWICTVLLVVQCIISSPQEGLPLLCCAPE